MMTACLVVDSHSGAAHDPELGTQTEHVRAGSNAGTSCDPIKKFFAAQLLVSHSSHMENGASGRSGQTLHAAGSSLTSMRNNEVRTVMLHGVPIVALVMDSAERLCLAQISNTLLKNFSYNEIHNR